MVVTEPYAIETASVTQHADVCDGPLWDPDAVHAIEAHGTIDITLGDATAMPCEVSADVQLVFGPDAPAWAPSSVDFSAEGVEVAGGCEPF